MTTTPEQREEFAKLIMPLIKYLNDNYHPYTTITITSTGAELSEGIYGIQTNQYIEE